MACRILLHAAPGLRHCIAVWGILTAQIVATGPPLPPSGLLCELMPPPAYGIDVDAPRFSWSLGSDKRGTAAVAYQVVVESTWDSGKVLGNDSALVEYGGPPLKSSTAYSWKVRWWSNTAEGPSEWSEPAVFVTGVLREADWRDAAFITCSESEAGEAKDRILSDPVWPVVGPPQCRHLRTEFEAPSRVKRATVHMAAMGWVELRLNGDKAGGNAVLEPGWSQYDQRLLYVTYDVTGLIRSGSRNAVGVILGNGWPGHLQHTPTVKLLIKLELLDDTEPFYVTSNPRGWSGTLDGPILLDDIYGGETYNATLELSGFDAPGYKGQHAAWRSARAYDDPSTKTAVLSAQPMAPIRAMELLPAKTVSSPDAGVYVFDIEQNVAGWARLELTNCQRGTVLKMSYGEVLHQNHHSNQVCSCSDKPTIPSCNYLENGTSPLLNPHQNCTWNKGMVNMQYLMCLEMHGSVTGARCQADVYVCKGGGSEVYEPRFTYHGFRYVQVEGLSEPPPTKLVSARVVHSDVFLWRSGKQESGELEFGGSASTSLTQLQSNIRWTQRDNLHSVPTDCPQRTERQGWMADGSVSAEEALLNFWMLPMYRNWVRSMIDVQVDWPSKDPLDKRKCEPQGRPDCVGAVTDTVPHPPRTFGTRPADPSWSAAIDLIYWYHLRYSGDLRTAKEWYPHLRDYILYMLSIAAKDPTGLCQWWTTGDWLEPHCIPGWPAERAGPMCVSKLRNSMTSAFNTILGVRIARDAAKLLGLEAEEQRLTRVLQDQLARWHRVYYNATLGTYGDGSQSVLSYTLFLDAAPTAELRETTLRKLVEEIRARDNHVSTGIISTKWMPEALSANGRSDVVLDLLLQTTPPSWLDQIAQGATTVWENWQYTDGPAMNSHNHPALASIGAWMYRWLAGIRIAERAEERGFGEGYKYVIFAPGVVHDPRVTSARASLPTQQGIVGISWSNEKSFAMNVTVPVNAAGEARMPSGLVSVSEGGRTLWSLGHDVSREQVREHSGIIAVRGSASAGVIIEIGSGAYTFTGLWAEKNEMPETVVVV